MVTPQEPGSFALRETRPLALAPLIANPGLLAPGGEVQNNGAGLWEDFLPDGNQDDVDQDHFARARKGEAGPVRREKQAVHDPDAHNSDPPALRRIAQRLGESGKMQRRVNS